jgi:DNA invertase Pin-like site-specific DNA recombinase
VSGRGCGPSPPSESGPLWHRSAPLGELPQSCDRLCRHAHCFDVLLCWRLDRLGRNLRHLVVLLEELRAVGVAFVSLNEGIDATTPAGKLQLHVLAALAEFERERIRERVHAGLARARAQGTRLGRPRKAPSTIVVPGGSVRAAAGVWGVSKTTAARWINAGRTSRLHVGGLVTP